MGRSAIVAGVVVVVVVGAVAACRPPHAPPPPPHGGTAEPMSVTEPALVAPAPIDAHARGAAYLTAAAQQIQPAWGQFLEDCRTRLPRTHPLNERTLVAGAELTIEPSGAFTVDRLATSANADFDAAVRGVLHDARLAPPPAELLADDDRVHVHWLFARDHRQAGAATASVVDRWLPVLEVVDREIAAHAIVRAARRVQHAIASGDADAAPATERVMIAALADALDDGDATTRAAAIAAIGTAKLVALAPLVRRYLSPTTSTQLRLAATLVARDLGDRGALSFIANSFASDLAEGTLAHADASALAALGARAEAAKVIAKTLAGIERAPAATTVQVAALSAFHDAPTAALVPVLVRAFARGDARTRAAICPAVATLPGAAGLVARGLGDANALVRATCAGAAAEKPVDRAVIAPLHRLATDRDRNARAQGTVALAALGAATAAELAALADDERDVRWQFAAGLADVEVTPALEPTLKKLAADRDVEIRALALAKIGGRDPEIVAAALADGAEPAVRAAAVRSGGANDLQLDALVSDADSAVATAAFAQLAARRGRVASADLGLARLSRALTAGARVDVAVAWLLAR